MHSNEEAQQLLATLKALYTALPVRQRDEVQIALLMEAHEVKTYEQA